MTNDQLSRILGINVEEIPLDENLFEAGILDSLSVLELVEHLSAETGIDVLILAADLAQISSVRKIQAFSQTNRGDANG